MSYKVKVTKSIQQKFYKKTLKHPQLTKQLENTIKKLREAPFYRGLRTHKADVQSSPTPACSSWVNEEYRLIWD
jgi:plasmid maintenance system killer protein